MKRITISLMTIALVGALIGGGIYAAFSDTESSTGNTFAAGTLDLKTNDEDGVTATIASTNMKPGQTVGPATIALRNAGSVDGATLDINVFYVNSDGTQPPEFPKTVTEDEFADELLVDTMSYDGTDLLNLVTDIDGDGKDMKEVAAADLTGQAGLDAAEAKVFTIQVTLKNITNNDFQADGIAVTFTFILNQ